MKGGGGGGVDSNLNYGVELCLWNFRYVSLGEESDSV